MTFLEVGRLIGSIAFKDWRDDTHFSWELHSILKKAH
jgi:hypothetical protein